MKKKPHVMLKLIKHLIAIVFLFLLFFIPFSITAEEYSLDDLYRLALERSETIKIAQENLYISVQGKDKAISALLPTLSTFVSHTRYNEGKYGATSVLQPEYSTSWGLRLDQSLSLSGRELTALKIANETIIKTIFDLDAVKEEYLLSVASAYYDVLKSKKAVEIVHANVERLRKHRDAAKTRLEVGEVTKTTLLRAEAELSGAESELIKAENSLRLAKVTLARIVGIDGDYDVKESHPSSIIHRPSEEISFLTVDCGLSNIDCLKQTALSERAELKALELRKRIAENEVRYAKGLYWPIISVEGVYSRKDNHPSSSFAIKESIYGGLKLNFPFFEGGLRKAEVREAEAKLRQAELNIADLKDTIHVEVENAYLNLITESGVLEKLRAEMEYSLDNYNAVSKQFKYGLANSIDVMDANTLLVTTERELTNAKYDYQLAILKLRRATGTLLKTVGSQ